MDVLYDLVKWYPLFGIPAGISWVAVWVSAGKRFDLQPGDRGLLFAPWIALYATSVVFPGDKGLANLLEIVVLAACVPAALALRAGLGRVANQEQLAARLLWSVCAVGVLLWLLVPAAQPLSGP